MFIPFIRKTWSRWEPTGERGSIKQGMKDEPLAEPNLCSDIMGQLIEISEAFVDFNLLTVFSPHPSAVVWALVLHVDVLLNVLS